MAQYHSPRISRQAPCGMHETHHLAWGHCIGSNGPSFFFLESPFSTKSSLCFYFIERIAAPQQSNTIIRGEEVMHFICFQNLGIKSKFHLHVSYTEVSVQGAPVFLTCWVGIPVSLVLIVSSIYHRLKYQSRDLLSPLLAGLESHFI